MTSDRWILLDLNPEPWRVGPASAIRRGGKVIPVIGRDQQLDAFKNSVAEQVRERLSLDESASPLFFGKLKVTIYLWRQRAEYSTPQARTHRKHEADATNMLKAVEDALQGVLFKNDRDNSDVRCVIVEQSAEVTSPRILIHVEQWVGLNPDEIPDALWAQMDARQEYLEFTEKQ